MTCKRILLLPGDGIGPEIIGATEVVLQRLCRDFGLAVEIDSALLGGCAVDATGEPYPPETRAKAHAADAILLGAVGGPKYDTLPRPQRPERGLLAIRQDLDLFANLRPARVYPQLVEASPLKPELVRDLDILIVRELTGDIYFGEPRGIELRNGERVGFNTMIYAEREIRRIAKVAFEAATLRRQKVCSVDKMNVLEATQLWREVVIDEHKNYPHITLEHLLVDNAAMQLIRAPKQFDVIVTGNMFGDILSDEASQLTGSIGLLPSASLNGSGKGLYEPIHGSAPDIAGQQIANPLATVLSLSMMLRYSLQRADLADKIEIAVQSVLDAGHRTRDLCSPPHPYCSTAEMGQAVADALI